MGLYISQACVVCACVLSLPLSLLSLCSGGSNVCYFFYTWPCLFGSTYQRRLVGASLPLPAYLPVWSGPVWSNACRQPCAFFFSFFSLFLSFLFLMTGMDGLYLSLPFSSVFLHHFLSLCALPAPPPPPPTPHVNDLTFGAPLTILQGSLRLLHVCVPVSVSEAQIDELGKWNKARWSGHLLEREGEWTRRTEGRETGLKKGAEGQRNELYVYVRGRNWLCAACIYQLFVSSILRNTHTL